MDRFDKMTTEQLRDAAEEVEGEIWEPHIVVSHEEEEGAWYWRDLAESPSDQWRGPFSSERAALLDVVRAYS
jgi:hypothetical protein